tara:strand:- start:4713 stop:5072 length:360 start_codon:yes stop_codon:yes gene_type:complete
MVKNFKQWMKMNEQSTGLGPDEELGVYDDDMFIAKGDSDGEMKKIIVATIKDGELGGIDFETMEAFDHLDGIYQELIGYEADQIYVIDARSIKYGDDISINAEDLMKGTHHLNVLKVYN